MIDLYTLVKNTSAYKIMLGEKEAGAMSHAYLITTADGENLNEYLKIFAKLIACDKCEPCLTCRTCKLIDGNVHPDVIFYPRGEKDISTADINDLIADSVIKPIEGDKKVFVICHAEKMNLPSQNKLLKTLEEPPKGVYILLGGESDFALLPTVKSRVKTLNLPPFSNQVLFEALKGECTDYEKLLNAIACGDGTVGKAKSLYSDENLAECINTVCDVIVDMKSSSDVLEFSGKVNALKCGLEQFLSVLDLAIRDLLCAKEGKNELIGNAQTFAKTKGAEGYSEGALIHILEKIVEAKKRKKFNANAQMLTEWLLFQILEGKYKWRKL